MDQHFVQCTSDRLTIVQAKANSGSMRSATESYGSYEIGYKWLLGMHKDLKTMSYDELNNIGIADDHLEHSVSVRVQQVSG